MLDEKLFPRPATSASAASPAFAPPAQEYTPVVCWLCKQNQASSFALIGKPICYGCRAHVNRSVDQELSAKACVSCGTIGVSTVTADRVAYCAMHESKEQTMQRRAQAATEMLQAFEDAHVLMADEIVILLGRLGEIVAESDGQESHESLAEGLRQACESAAKSRTSRMRWCVGWRAYCAGEPKTYSSLEATEGWIAASSKIGDDPLARAAWLEPGKAEGAFAMLASEPYL
jgi:hypothetical protein